MEKIEKSGFTLLEVMIALSIMAVALTGLAQAVAVTLASEVAAAWALREPAQSLGVSIRQRRWPAPELRRGRVGGCCLAEPGR